MAKYVMLRFEDDKEADILIEAVQSGDVSKLDTVLQFGSAFVRAVFKIPTKFCECTSVKNRGWTRGKKYGWWVCSICHKPSKSWGTGHHWFLGLGKNLLPVDNRAPEYRGDGVFARHHSPCETCGTTLISEMGMAQAKVWCPKCEVYK